MINLESRIEFWIDELGWELSPRNYEGDLINVDSNVMKCVINELGGSEVNDDQIRSKVVDCFEFERDTYRTLMNSKFDNEGDLKS